MSELLAADVLGRVSRWREAWGFNPERARRSNPDDEFGFLVTDLAAALEYMKAERDLWNERSGRLSAGLIKLAEAPKTAPASVLRSVAYDIALNCITPDIAEFQIERRAGLIGDPALHIKDSGDDQ